MTKIIIHNHLATRDAKYKTVEQLRSAGFKMVSKGNNGWTEIYENDDEGEAYKVEYGPQPSNVRSITEMD